jgi:CRISPR-associated protein Cas2
MTSTYGGFRTMWLTVLFDLPTVTATDRKTYTQFRKFLLRDGFVMLQYSVYARHCASEENAIVHINRIKASLPDKGEVRILRLTDKQFNRMEVFIGKNRTATETAPMQYELF